MNIEQLLKMNCLELEKEFSISICWKKRAVIRGLYRLRSENKDLFYKGL